jgi:hypothetical protein
MIEPMSIESLSTRTEDELDAKIVEAIGLLYEGFYGLQCKQLNQRAYDNMGVIINMLREDQQLLLKKPGVVE